jgi:hypothetical protein
MSLREQFEAILDVILKAAWTRKWVGRPFGPLRLAGPPNLFLFCSSTQKHPHESRAHATPKTQESRHKPPKRPKTKSGAHHHIYVRMSLQQITAPSMRAGRHLWEMMDLSRFGPICPLLAVSAAFLACWGPLESPSFSLCASEGAQRASGTPHPPGAPPAPTTTFSVFFSCQCARCDTACCDTARCDTARCDTATWRAKRLGAVSH